MITKPSVDIEGLHPLVKAKLPEMEAARLTALECLLDMQMCVTSGAEGKPGDQKHSRQSYHYPDNCGGKGMAVDLRTKDFVTAWADYLRKALGDGWDVVVEPTHIHVERDIHRAPLTTAEQGGVR